MRGLSMFTSNAGPPDVSRTSPRTDRPVAIRARQGEARPASNASAIMISDVLMDVFMPSRSPQIVAVVKGREGVLFGQYIELPKIFLGSIDREGLRDEGIAFTSQPAERAIA